MGYQDREYYRGDEPGSGMGIQATSLVMRLIILNAAIWLIELFTTGDQAGTSPLVNALKVTDLTIVHPWQWYQFLTAGFLHDVPVPHIFGNMLGLFVFGQALEERWGWKEMLRFYLLAIVVGFVGFSAIHYYQNTPGLWTSLRQGVIPANLAPSIGCIGASGAVTACIVMFCLYYPKQTLLLLGFIPVPAWALGLAVVLMDVMGGFHAGSTGGTAQNVAYEVHLFGAVLALAYWRFGWNLVKLPGLATVEGWLGRVFHPNSAPAAYRVRQNAPALRVHDPHDPDEMDEGEMQAEVDRYLSKISASGLESLTSRERKVLEEHSRRLRLKRR